MVCRKLPFDKSPAQAGKHCWLNKMACSPLMGLPATTRRGHCGKRHTDFFQEASAGLNMQVEQVKRVSLAVAVAAAVGMVS